LEKAAGLVWITENLAILTTKVLNAEVGETGDQEKTEGNHLKISFCDNKS
jgi:hypothetical protein